MHENAGRPNRRRGWMLRYGDARSTRDTARGRVIRPMDLPRMLAGNRRWLPMRARARGQRRGNCKGLPDFHARVSILEPAFGTRNFRESVTWTLRKNPRREPFSGDALVVKAPLT